MEKILTTTRYIYRCTNKACSYTYALDFDVLIYMAGRHPSSYSYTMQNPPAWINPNMTRHNPQFHTKCPKCGCFARYDAVKGHKNDTPCDHRCTSAKGSTCDCSCGGMNHGRDHLPGAGL